MVKSDPPRPLQMVFVFAGRPERKLYGLSLLHNGYTPRVIFSVGRYEVRAFRSLGLETEPDLAQLARATPPEQRHFFVDRQQGSTRASVRPSALGGTYRELASLADYLQPSSPASIAMVSTSIHLRRVSWCCQRLGFSNIGNVFYWPVPEDLSSFRREGWWRRGDHWAYVMNEYAKLCVYRFRFPPAMPRAGKR